MDAGGDRGSGPQRGDGHSTRDRTQLRRATAGGGRSGVRAAGLRPGALDWLGADGPARDQPPVSLHGYGTDWLAFAHFVIAIAFVGALREPVRNRWLFDFGLIAAGLVIPFALLAGGLRGIPFYWRWIDCSFGVGAALPLWYCRKWARQA